MFNDEKYYTAEQGRIDALKDIADNKLIIRMAGRPANWVSTWIDILKENNIRYSNSGCLVFDGLFEYIEAYNKVSGAEIKRRFGDDFLDKTQARAIELNGDKDFFTYKPILNDNPEMGAKANQFGWVKCPNCHISFKITSSSSWDGERHKSCEQKIRLTN